MAIQRHFFVCTTERPPFGKPSCGANGSAEILAAFLGELESRPELAAEVRVTGCSCLGPCFDGPTVVVYPEGTWYAGVRVEDVPEIAASHMVGGRPVERLVHPGPVEGG